MIDSNGIAHEIWAAAQLMPGEGIEDGVDRIVSLLQRFSADAQRTQRDNDAQALRKFCTHGNGEHSDMIADFAEFMAESILQGKAGDNASHEEKEGGEFLMFTAHKCNGKKWRGYPKLLCSCCNPLSESYDMVFSDQQQYQQHKEQDESASVDPETSDGE